MMAASKSRKNRVPLPRAKLDIRGPRVMHIPAHGYPHRHYFGKISPEPTLSWDEISEKFEREWRLIAIQFLEGEL